MDQVYDCDYANHCLNIKNLLEYNPSYAKSVGTNEYYFLDTTRHANGTKYTNKTFDDRQGTATTVVETDNPNYNKGFAARKQLLVASTEVNCEIPLNSIHFLKNFKRNFFPT